MPTERTRVYDDDERYERPPKLIFGQHIVCKKCKGKGTRYAEGRTRICYRCGGSGSTTTRSAEEEGG